jgi:3-dehydroquinate synthetase
VAIKAGIVGRDERETSGERSLLNYGHTVAHGLEAATGYGRFLHGEAVALGMAAAGRISHRLGLLSGEELAAQEDLLERFGLPQSCRGVDPGRVLEAMALDKKVRAGKVRWVLLEGIGRATLREDVPPEVVREALKAIIV